MANLPGSMLYFGIVNASAWQVIFNFRIGRLSLMLKLIVLLSRQRC